ncbi:PAS domain-containing protein [Achromobacter sp. Root170]|uniref:PAS domain-containing protein n=1 Tax=Achromobacter sp. Root170 TaxID=1736480 RepID=UPI0006FD1943|nr:PAS domain-containing protein [Achromobacter sp. Root170]KRB16015.1 histidine kinase [Achromobacter sp. Root170]
MTEMEPKPYRDAPALAQGAALPEFSLFGEPAEVARVLSQVGVPCLVLARSGEIVAASAVLPLARESLVNRHVSQVYGLGKPLRMGDGAVDVVYRSPGGARVPAQLIPLCTLDSGELIVLVNDGAPFREAESHRFERTPYAVFRLDMQGVIRFANPEAARTLGLPREALCGTRLAARFRPSDGGPVQRAILRCVQDTEGDAMVAVTIAIPVPDDADRQFELVMTPDPAPNGELLGVIAVIQSRTLESARDEIRRIALDPAIAGWRLKLDRILEQIRRLIPFEHAVFGIYGNDVSLFRAIAVRPEGVELWPARWMDLPPTIRAFLDSGQTWVDEIGAFVQKNMPQPGNEVVRCYQDLGIEASVTLPVTRPDGYSSALSLCSRQPGAYGERHLEMLRALDLEPVLMRFEKERDDERAEFADSLRRKVMAAASLRQAAEEIIVQLAQHFSWDHVALYRVNRQENRFEVVTQHSLAPAYALPDGYQQPTSQGMLGATLAQGCLLAVDDIGNPAYAQHGYGGPKRPLRSAMTVPIHLNGRIRWLLDVESSVSHAFKGPDIDDLLQIIASLEEGLAQHLLNQTKQSLMAETEQAVVFVGREGAVIEMNRVATDMLGAEPRRGRSLDEAPAITDYAIAGDEATQGILTAPFTVKRERIELLDSTGQPRSVLATRTDLDPSLDMSIWFFTDIADLGWARDLRYLRETVAEVARQTRTSLSLACSLTSQTVLLHEDARQGMPAEEVAAQAQDLSQRIVAEIGKADITFERLAGASESRRRARAMHSDVELGARLQDVVAALPARDQRRIALTNCTASRDGPTVSGDAQALSAAFRSMTDYLLRCRNADDARVTIDLDAGPDGCTIRFGLSEEQLWEADPPAHAVPDDALLSAERAAHDGASIAITQIQETVIDHGGALITDPPLSAAPLHPADAYATVTPPWRAFTLILPLRSG